MSVASPNEVANQSHPNQNKVTNKSYNYGLEASHALVTMKLQRSKLCYQTQAAMNTT